VDRNASFFKRLVTDQQVLPKEKTDIMKQQKLHQFSRFMTLSLKWLARITRVRDSSLAERILEKFLLILRTRGKREAIKFSSELRASVYAYLRDKQISQADKILPASKELPRSLKFLRRISTLGGYPLIRLILSALYASRALELPVKISAETIEGAPKPVPDSLGLFVDDFWHELGYRYSKSVPRSARWSKFHLTTKVGPNGHALWSSVADLFALPDDLYKSVAFVGGHRLKSRMDRLKLTPYYWLIGTVIPVNGKRYRKVTPIPSYEGKTREVAILDYWSQTALYGLHTWLFSVLRKIPQDCTFNQGSFRDKLEEREGTEAVFNRSMNNFWSVDLTAATDRFPIKLIEIVLRGRLPDDYVNHWHNIMVGHPFDFQKRKIYYACGNPWRLFILELFCPVTSLCDILLL